MNIHNTIGQKITLPNNILAEKMVLAGMIGNSNFLYKTVGAVDPEIFFNEKHKAIYISIIDTYKKKEMIDLLSIMDQLTKNNKSEYIGELREIEQLGQTLVNNEIFEEYLYLLIDKFIRRSIITSMLSLLEVVANEMTSVTVVLNKFEELFLNLNQKNYISTKEIQLTYLLPSLVQGIEKKYRNSSLKDGVCSGFNNLDEITEGFQKSDLIIIASRPGMGKTAFVLNIARNITLETGLGLVFFSLEMTSEQLLYRILASKSRVSLSNLKTGNLKKNDWIEIKKAVVELSKAKLYIDDTPRITISKLRSKIYQLLQNNEKLHCVIIDYLQLIESESSIQNESRYQALSLTTRSLKIMAREFNLPIIVLSQLSRNVESRSNKRPLLSDLRESGCLSYQSYININKKNIQIKAIPFITYKFASTINQTNNIVLSSIKKIYNSQNKIVYQLVTKSGYYLEASANHRLLTKNGWKHLSVTKKGEYIACVKMYTKKASITSLTRSEYLKRKYDRIESIHIHKKADLFDIEMQTRHNFIANKIVVHNSIEQDADVVCMLYRQSYYNSEQNIDDIAEISILKHRNGPTGTIELKFHSQFAEFTQV
uniref:replication helicase subunit n=1 Tax=Sahlingia subintegra TaxID=468936 RepID=UPI001FCD2561|nr:replication helicase subunit [Sahlingia subintegra]UNJ17279.1 replication helicase subunit [Sahlingia subintegra]